MANWKKVIVSGSDASLNSLSVLNSAQVTGSLFVGSNTIGQTSATLTGSFTGSFEGLASTASLPLLGIITASIAASTITFTKGDSTTFDIVVAQSGSVESASYALNAQNAYTASSVGTLTQPVVISGSLSVNTTTGNSFDINADTLIFTGSFNQTGSVFLTGLTEVSKSYVVGYDQTTGQLTYQTAVDNADTASFAISASYAVTASYAETASFVASSSYAVSSSNAVSSSYAISASYAINSSNSISSSYALTASALLGSIESASYALTASFVATASYAVSSSNSISSSYALIASTALSGDGIFSGSFSGSYVGDGSGLTGVVAASAFSLTEGTGITDFSYNGGAVATVAVSGAAALTSGSITKWSGNAFVNSSISDLGNVTINNAGGVLIQQGGLYVTGSSTFHDNVVVQGNLTVAGTASFQNTQNLEVADQFILLNSGSVTFQDSGFIIATGNAGNSGSAFFLETAGTTTGSPQNGRFAVAGSVSPDATTVTAGEYANTTLISAIDPTTEVPQFGGSGLGQGNMWVNTENGDIYIYA